MIHSIKYYLLQISLFVFINVVCFFLANRFFIEKGKVSITIHFQSFHPEDLSLYWNDGKGLSDQQHQTLSTKIDKYIYEFNLNNIDSLTEIRIDPDSDFNIALLKEVNIKGLAQAITISKFTPSRLNGLNIVEQEGQTVLQKIHLNADPYILLPIPRESKIISHKYSPHDIVILVIVFLFSTVLFVLIKSRVIKPFLDFKLSHLALLSIFFMTTSIYWTNTLLNFYTSPPSIENRSLASKPNFDSLYIQPKKYFKSYTEWFGDHFAFKHWMVFLNSSYKLGFFGSSPMADKMYIGKNFEFFSANSLLTDDVTGKRRLSVEEIQSLFANTLYKQKHLSAQNISYYLTVPPSKQTIYEDLLPDYLYLQRKSFKMIDQLSAEIKSKQANYYINVIDVLKERHILFPGERVFYQYDLHWSDWGAFLAYQKLMSRIWQEHPWVGKPLTEKDIDIDTLYTEDADLAKLILMNKKYKKETYIFKYLHDSIKETVVNGVYPFPIYKYKNEKAKGRVLVFRDSYSEQWKWLIARHFNESIFIWDQNISQKLIDEYHPDIVIQENCEMFLFYLFNPFK